MAKHSGFRVEQAIVPCCFDTGSPRALFIFCKCRSGHLMSSTTRDKQDYMARGRQHNGQSRSAQSRQNQARTGNTPTLAAIDLGTNNCRLLIARPTWRGHTPRDWNRPYYGESGLPFRIIDAFSRITRLGEGLAHTGELSENAIERTITALMICASKMRRRNVTNLRCITTEACRRAANCDDFIKRVSLETGINLEIISGEEEATLGLIGCLPLLDVAKPNALIFDIGGGSTEVSWLQLDDNGEFDLTGTISIPFGVVTLTETWGGQMDPLRKDGGTLEDRAYKAIQSDVLEKLDQFDKQHGISTHVKEGSAQMVGISGTVTTLAGINLRLRRYDRSQVDGIYLSTADMHRTIRELRQTTNTGRAAYPCIGPRRADLVLPGCAVLDAILDMWPIEGLRVADRGLREGLLYTMSSTLQET